MNSSLTEVSFHFKEKFECLSEDNLIKFTIHDKERRNRNRNSIFLPSYGTVTDS